MTGIHIHPASFRDPSGFVFEHNGKLYRQVNKVYKENYDLLMQSGLYTHLTNKKILLPHQEVSNHLPEGDDFYKLLLPDQLDFISYPYEWSFGQLKDAALLTLEIMNDSIEKAMILKDATPFNIQFYKGKPIFIDTLSFEKYDETRPWVAYRQFCECFLFPLLLGKYNNAGLLQLLGIYTEGIPVNLTAQLLPFKSRFNTGVWLHVFLQNRISKKKDSGKSVSSFSKIKMRNLVRHLESVIQQLEPKTESHWSAYYRQTILSKQYLYEKEKIVEEILASVQGKKLLDLGTNDGYFSLLAARKNFDVIAIDSDEQCADTLYQKTKAEKIPNLLPLRIDITNPSPSTGFNNAERPAFLERIKPDVIMALALVHHLVIGKNIPLHAIAALLYKLTPRLIIEFIPREDEKTKQLMLLKKDIYTGYTKNAFESSFKKYFLIEKEVPVPGTERVIYLMKRTGQL